MKQQDYNELGFLPKQSRESNHRKKSEKHEREKQKQFNRKKGK